MSELLVRVKRIAPVVGFGWRLVTLTLQRDPTDPATGTPRALRAAVQGLWAAVTELWDGGMRRRGAALYATCEFAGSGNVHMHLLAYVPFLNKEWVESIVKKAFARFAREAKRTAGFSDIRLVARVRRAPAPDRAVSREDATDPQEALEGAIREVVKYCTKSASTKDERWLEGGFRECMDPLLAANWEVATNRVHRHRMFGALRGKVDDEGVEEVERSVDAEEDEPEDAAVQCDECGIVGQFDWLTGNAAKIVAAMHANGQRALVGSRWVPPDPPPVRGVVDSVRDPRQRGGT